MKRLNRITLVLLLAVFCVFSVSVYADTVLTIDELGMTVSFPDDLILLTRDVSDSTEGLSLIGMTANEVKSMLMKNNMYVNAIHFSDTEVYEINVTMIADTGSQKIDSFNSISDSMLDEMGKSMFDLPEYKEAGFHYIDSSVETVNKTKYITLDQWQYNGDDKVYGKQYYTVNNGQSINITLLSYTGEITQSQRNTLRSVVNSVVFATTGGNGAYSGTSGSETFFSGLLSKVGGGLISGAIMGVIIYIVSKARKNKRDESAETGTAQTTDISTDSVSPFSNLNNSAIGQSMTGANEVVHSVAEHASETLTASVTTPEKEDRSPAVSPYANAPNPSDICLNSSVSFCRKCGAKLMSDSEFCHKCGMAVVR